MAAIGAIALVITLDLSIKYIIFGIRGRGRFPTPVLPELTRAEPAGLTSVHYLWLIVRSFATPPAVLAVTVVLPS